MKYNPFKNKKFILFVIACLIVVTAVVLTFKLFFREEKITRHGILADEYVQAYMTDNPGEQYYMLDVSLINPDDNKVNEVVENYDRKPMVKKDYSVIITNTREATESIVKKINNIYSGFAKGNSENRLIEAKTAYRYNVKIKDKKINKNLHNVSFWVVHTTENEWKICTVFEYERSIDKCIVNEMY